MHLNVWQLGRMSYCFSETQFRHHLPQEAYYESACILSTAVTVMYCYRLIVSLPVPLGSDLEGQALHFTHN